MSVPGVITSDCVSNSCAFQKSVSTIRKLLTAERSFVTSERHTFSTFLDVIQARA
jgi:hypothetical protein